MDKPRFRHGEPPTVDYDTEGPDSGLAYMQEREARYQARLRKEGVSEFVERVQGLPANPPARTDAKTDTEKKPEKKRRAMTKEARACANRYRKLKRKGENPRIKHVVSDYVADNRGQSETGILRILRDNPGEWKTDKKRTS